MTHALRFFQIPAANAGLPANTLREHSVESPFAGGGSHEPRSSCQRQRREGAGTCVPAGRGVASAIDCANRVLRRLLRRTDLTSADAPLFPIVAPVVFPSDLWRVEHFVHG